MEDDPLDKNDQKDDPRYRIIRKLVLWAAFSVCVALLSILANLFALAIHKMSIDLNSLVSHDGDLVLVAVALTAEALSDMFAHNKTEGILNTTALALCFIVFTCSTLFFGAVLASTGPLISETFEGTTSIVFFVCTLIVAGLCKVIAEV